METSGKENDSGVMLEPSFDLRVDVSVKEVSFKRRHTLRYLLHIMSNIFVFLKYNYKFKVKTNKLWNILTSIKIHILLCFTFLKRKITQNCLIKLKSNSTSDIIPLHNFHFYCYIFSFMAFNFLLFRIKGNFFFEWLQGEMPKRIKLYLIWNSIEFCFEEIEMKETYQQMKLSIRMFIILSKRTKVLIVSN